MKAEIQIGNKARPKVERMDTEIQTLNKIKKAISQAKGRTLGRRDPRHKIDKRGNKARPKAERFGRQGASH